MNKNNKKYIYLRDATKYCDYSQGYLSLRARQGKLKAKKIGRDWFTTKEWIEGYIAETNGNKNGFKKHSVISPSVARPKTEKPKITSTRNAVFVKAVSAEKVDVVKPVSEPPANLPIGEFEYTPIKLTPQSLGFIDKVQGTFALIKKKSSVTRKISLPFVPVFATALILLIASGVFFKSSLASTLQSTKPYIATMGCLAKEAVKDIANGTADIVAESFTNVSDDINNTIPEIANKIDKDGIYATTSLYTMSIFDQYQQWVGNTFKSAYNFVVSPWAKAEPVIVQKQEQKSEAIQEPQQVVVKETIVEREVSKVTRVEPIKEITKEVTKIDDVELANIKKQINVFASWEQDIQNLEDITAKLWARPTHTITPNAPIYIASQGLQVGGNGNFASLGVSGSAGIKDLGVGNSTTLGTDSSDALTVNATSTFGAPVTMSSGLTVGSLTTSGTGTFNDLVVDTDLIYTDSTNDYVGIGTTSPDSKLDVNGTVKMTGLKLTTTPTTGYVLTSDANGTGTWQVATGSGGSGDFSDGGEAGGADRTLGNTDNYDFGFLTNNLNRLHIQNDGNVGIGTTSPSSKLQVSGDVLATSFSIGANTLTTEFAYLDGLDQSLATTTSPTFAGLTLTNAITEFSTDGTLAGDSDSAVPTEKAVKTYVDLTAGSGLLSGLTDTTITDISDTELLQYDNGTSKWINQTLAEAGVQATLTFGIANTNAVQIDDADAADNDYAKFTATGLEGRSYAEVKTDLSLNSVENTALSTWAGTTSITTLGTISAGTWQGTTIAVDQGGTGQTTYTNGQLLIGNTTGNTLAKATLTQGTGITIANGTGTITITNASPNVDQNIWETVAGDTGSVAANTTTDTLTIAGAGIASTAVAGDTLTITATEADTLDTVTGRGATTTNAVTLGNITSGAAGVDGKLTFYSEQGATDYSVSLNPHSAMTSAANFYLPADEPAGTYLLNMTTGGVIGYDTNTYITGNQSITLSGDVAGTGATSITTTIGSDKILESMLKSVNSPTDEYVLTYESTTGDFEWQAALTGTVDTSGTPIDDDYAKFIDADTIEGRSYTEMKTDLSLNSVENTALSTWAGTTSITTLGTISAGTWQGTTIAVDQGGTGQTTYTNGQLLIGNTTGSTLTKATLTQGTGITIANGTGTITITNASPNVDQNLWATVAGDTGSVAANTTTDTLTIAGAGIASTAVSGDTLTITATEADTLATVTGRGATTNNSVTFAGVTLNNTGLHLLDSNASHDLIIKPGSDVTADRTLTITTGDSNRTLTLSGNPTIDDWFDQSV